MKKLMIAAATAALAAGAFAAEPQVYEMTLTVKSTQCATGKKTVKVCEDIEFTSYRKQITRKYEGLFWGCGCEVIACPDYYFKGLDFDHDTVAPNQETDYIFWSATKGFQYGLYGDDDAFQWQILQLVGPKAQNIEGTWTLVLKNAADEIVLDVKGAGYGTAFEVCKNGEKKIKSMSGYVVGSVDYAAEAEVSGCQYCGELTECTPFQFCDCIDVQDKTALFGSWSLKYNSSAAKKLAQGKYIESAYKFPKYLNLGNYTEDAGEGETEQTAAQKAEAAYKEAVTALAEAETAAEEAGKALDTWNTGDAKTEGSKAKFEADIAAAKTAATTKAGAAQTAANNAKTALKGETVSGSKLGDAYITNLEKVAELEKTIKEETDQSKVKAAQAELESYNTALKNTKDQIAALTGDTKTQFDKLVSDYETTKATNETAQAEKAAADKADADKAKTEAAKLKELTDAKAAADKAKTEAEEEVKSLRIACIAAGGDCL